MRVLISISLAILLAGCDRTEQRDEGNVASAPVEAPPSKAAATPPAPSRPATVEGITVIEGDPLAPAGATDLSRLGAPGGDRGQNFGADTSGGIVVIGNGHQYKMILPADVLFDFDKSTLRPEAVPMLEKAAVFLRDQDVMQLQSWGHTDAKGDEPYNDLLSQRRAKAVADWFKARKVTPDGLVLALGKGEREPLVANANPDGSDNILNRQRNRRVELHYVKNVRFNDIMKEVEARR